MVPIQIFAKIQKKTISFLKKIKKG